MGDDRRISARPDTHGKIDDVTGRKVPARGPAVDEHVPLSSADRLHHNLIARGIANIAPKSEQDARRIGKHLWVQRTLAGAHFDDLLWSTAIRTHAPQSLLPL